MLSYRHHRIVPGQLRRGHGTISTFADIATGSQVIQRARIFNTQWSDPDLILDIIS